MRASSRIGDSLPTALTAGGRAVQYRYSASGQRTYKKEGTGSPEYYVLDGSATLAVVEGGSPQFWNVLTPSGESIGRHLASGGRRYYRKDHLGSVRAVVAGNGTVQETRDYYPFGLMMPGRETMESVSAKEDYTGHELDAETGLHYAGARYYMSALGRWTSGEPLLNGDPRPLLNDQRRVLLGASPYNYSLNNPTNLRDPDGRCPVCVVAVWAVAEVGLAAYDAYNAYQTHNDPNATPEEKSNALRMAALGAVGPGGGYNSIARAADHMVGRGKAARALLPRLSSKSKELISELGKQGVKHSPDDIIRIGRGSGDEIVFLERGNSEAGLQHILQRHGDQFAQRGIATDEVGDAVFKAATEGNVVGYQSGGRPIYEIKINEEVHRIAVTIGDNGFIVGANPAK